MKNNVHLSPISTRETRILQAVNRLFSSQYHLPLTVFLQEVGKILPLERAAVYSNRLDFRWQLVASKVASWSKQQEKIYLPDTIEYQEIWPGLETKLSTGQEVSLSQAEIESLGYFEQTKRYVYVFPLLEGKWWTGVLLLDFGTEKPKELDLSLAKEFADSLSIAIKRQKRESEYLDTTRIFQELLNNIPDLVILVDAKGHWLLANKRALKILGFRRHVYQGLSFEEITKLRPEFAPLLERLSQVFKRIEKRGEPLQETIKITDKEKKVWFDFLFIPFKCDEENRVLIIGHEITSVKLAQERLLSILEHLPAMVYIVHPSSKRILYHNSLFKDYFGDQLLGKAPCHQLLFGYDHVCGFCHIEKSSKDFKTSYEIYDNKHKTWLRIYEVYILWLDKEIVRLGMIQDVTNEKQQEERLIRSQKLEILGKLTGNIAHEFNNILAIINGYADIIFYRTNEEKTKNYVAKIQQAVSTGTNLIKQLLMLSRSSVSEKKIDDLNKVIDEQVEVLKKIVGEQIKIEVDLCPDPLPVNISFEGFQHILTNLIINARDAMPPEGGVITIKTERVGREEQEGALLEIRDTGRGIPSESLAQIFDPFYTTKAPGEGAGLGLTIILSLVRKAGGDIQVESRLGEGTTFKIWLPFYASVPEGRAKDRPISDIEGQEVSSKKILIVEDEPHIREMLAEMLEGQGFVVNVAENGEEALKWLKDHNYEVDLVITDVVMPKMDGVELYRLVQKEAPHVKILFISGYAHHVLEKYGFEEGHFHILKKPFTFKQLLDEIDKAFSGPSFS